MSVTHLNFYNLRSHTLWQSFCIATKSLLAEGAFEVKLSQLWPMQRTKLHLIRALPQKAKPSNLISSMEFVTLVWLKDSHMQARPVWARPIWAKLQYMACQKASEQAWIESDATILTFWLYKKEQHGMGSLQKIRNKILTMFGGRVEFIRCKVCRWLSSAIIGLFAQTIRTEPNIANEVKCLLSA